MRTLILISMRPLLLLTTACCVALPRGVEAPAKEPTKLQPIVATGTSMADLEDKVVLSSCCGDFCNACQEKQRDKGCESCCEAICCPKQVSKKVEKHCWKVKKELVCVPGFRWPWEKCRAGNPDCGECCGSGCKCCKPRCGAVRCVNVLEKHEYTCEECSYEWEVKRVCTSGCCTRSTTSCPHCGTACMSEEKVDNEVTLASGQENAEAENAPELNSTAMRWRYPTTFGQYHKGQQSVFFGDHD